MSKSTLFKQYKNACTDYILAFERKQGLCFEFWIADRVGEMACFGDWCIMLTDIIHDIETKQPKGRIIEWHDKMLPINYQTYIKTI
jgi:hypothetical protein